MAINVGEKRGIIPKEGENPKLYFHVTEENVNNVRRYDSKEPQDKEWLFTDAMHNDVIDNEGYNQAQVSFTDQDGDLKMDVGLMRAGRRTRKVKRSNQYKKRSTARRRRSSKRQSRRSRKVNTRRR
jgi:hypothetical protein